MAESTEPVTGAPKPAPIAQAPKPISPTFRPVRKRRALL
jgi:hypothetical protein